MNEILIHWEITEKEADVIADAIRSGLEDAAVRGEHLVIHMCLFCGGAMLVTVTATANNYFT